LVDEDIEWNDWRLESEQEDTEKIIKSLREFSHNLQNYLHNLPRFLNQLLGRVNRMNDMVKKISSIILFEDDYPEEAKQTIRAELLELLEQS
jgi:hypothetical protein